eukprot:4586300-Amphidinium_carterae.1
MAASAPPPRAPTGTGGSIPSKPSAATGGGAGIAAAVAAGAARIQPPRIAHAPSSYMQNWSSPTCHLAARPDTQMEQGGFSS